MDTETLRARLAEAEKAYHELMVSGGVRTLVDQSGERIEFSPTNLSRLRAYIAELKLALGEPVVPRGPMGVFF
ncbi:head-tail joining protein [Labrenzia sp. C1B10]|uniref:gpW family head-tail joining protein n=1 Tax=unclassified Labrenzia TaxID=2648686 RepID=UPI0003B80A2A|nr:MULTISPECIES: gpW family head-tail joining protein [unclassified Labrenzia]ERP95648.1 head-tail joining protein [Labrenzia sp. C1B10]ERS05714.1 head-tail joining protein [Labrenzia sp. C1B70]